MTRNEGASRGYGNPRQRHAQRGNAFHDTQNQVVETPCWFDPGQGHQPTLQRSFGWQANPPNF